VGGVVGGVVPPPRPAAAPMVLDESYVRKRRIAGQDPAYPPRAESKGIEGIVVARVTIDTKGRVSQCVFLRTDPAFEQAVRKAITSWRFTPHVVGGDAVSVHTVFRFIFKLT
jgi:TonB family protein